MKCRKILFQLNAYTDGELPKKQHCAVKDHLANCEACRKRLEDIHGLEGILNDALHVPAVPDGFAARIMAEARKRQQAEIPERHSLLPVWNSLQWIAGLSAPMRIAAFATVLLALVAGLSFDGGHVTGRNVPVEEGKNLYGLEWFAPATPGSIGSIYIDMAYQPHEKGRVQ